MTNQWGARVRVGLVLILTGIPALAAQEARAQEGVTPAQMEATRKRAQQLEQEGNYQEAVKEREKVLAWSRKLNGDQATYTLVAASMLAVAYREVGQLDKVEALYQYCLKGLVATKGRNHTTVATVLNQLGYYYDRVGQFGKALECYTEARSIYKANNEPLDVSYVDSNLATLYEQIGRWCRADGDEAQAKEWFGKARTVLETNLEFRKRAAPTELRLLISKLGDAAYDLKQYQKADEYYQQAKELGDREKGRGWYGLDLMNLGLSRLALERYDGALDFFQQAQTRAVQVNGKDTPEVAHLLAFQARTSGYKQNWDKAAAAMDRSRRIERRYLGHLFPGLSEAEQLSYLFRPSNLGQRLDVALSLGLARRTEPRLVESSAEWLLNSKAIAQQALAERAVLARDSAGAGGNQLLQEWLSVRSQLARLALNPPPGDPARYKQRLEQLNAREQELAKRFGQADRAAPWVYLKEVRQVLAGDAVFIDLARFAVCDFKSAELQAPHYAAWVIPAKDKGDVRLIDLGPAAAIDAAVQKVRQALQTADKTILQKGEADTETALREPLDALAKLVLHPLLPHAGKAAHLVLSPESQLWLVPWAALPLPDGKYAVEQYTLRYVVSGRDLTEKTAAAATGASLVLADPDFDLSPDQARDQARTLLKAPASGGETRGVGRGLQLPRVKRLEFSAAEGTAIARHLQQYTAAKPQVHTGAEALETVAKAARQPRVLVLSTHGYFQPAPSAAGNALRANGSSLENPLLRCGLLLAGCNCREQLQGPGDEDGVLTGVEIVGIDLRGTELVVLSACETGLGDVRNGEGVAGLRQAFQLAGAQSVVATLWQVPDQQSAQLMIGFFENLTAKQGRAEAMRNAQLALIKARREKRAAAHPFFWAAFTVTGR
jgi:CHAT domain-containing protein